MHIRFAVIVKLISAFVFISRIFLFFQKLKFPASNHLLRLYSSVCVRPVRKPPCWLFHDAAHCYECIITRQIELHCTLLKVKCVISMHNTVRLKLTSNIQESDLSNVRNWRPIQTTKFLDLKFIELLMYVLVVLVYW